MKNIWFILQEILHKGLGPLKARMKRRTEFMNDTSWERACLANDYGAGELRRNEQWYAWTALGVGCVLFLNVVFVPVWTGMLNERSAIEDKRAVVIACPGGLIWEHSFIRVPPSGPVYKYGTRQKSPDIIMPIPVPEKELVLRGFEKDRINQIITLTEATVDPLANVPFVDSQEQEKTAHNVEPGIGCTFYVDQEPVPVNLKEIARKIPYPSHLRGDGGPIMLRILIDKKGLYVKHIPIGNNYHPELLAAVETQIDQLKFVPAIQSGQLISCWVTVPFRFR